MIETAASTRPAAPPVVPSAGRARRHDPGRWILFGFVLLATAMTLLPIAIIVLTAFKPVAEVNGFPPTFLPETWTLDNFVRIFEDLPFARLVLNSFVFAGGVTVLALLFDSMAAYALARIDFRGNRILLLAIIASLMIPFQALLIPVYQIIADLGWINTYWGLIIPRAADAFGIFFLRQFFLALPRDLDSAARLDGASEFRIYRSVVLPNAVPALMTLGVYIFVNNWNDLLWPLVLSTDESMATITSGLTMLTGPGGIVPYGVMMAGSFIALVPLAVIFILMQKRFVASVASTGLK
jgi:multiple sugar transport system permease protein